MKVLACTETMSIECDDPCATTIVAKGLLNVFTDIFAQYYLLDDKPANLLAITVNNEGIDTTYYCRRAVLN